MPTYEYRCGNCGHELEAVQAFTDAPLSVCPECGQEALRKLFGNVGVVFKGPGFYRTDSRKDGKGATSPVKKSGDKAAESSDGAGSSTAAKPDKSSDAKPAGGSGGSGGSASGGAGNSSAGSGGKASS